MNITKRVAVWAATLLGTAGLAVVVPSGSASATTCNWSEEWASTNWVYSTTAVTTVSCQYIWTNGWKTGSPQRARGWGNGGGTWHPSSLGFKQVGMWNGPSSPGVRLSNTTANGVQVLAQAESFGAYINLGV